MCADEKIGAHLIAVKITFCCTATSLASPKGRGGTAQAVTERVFTLPSPSEIKDFGQLPHRGSQDFRTFRNSILFLHPGEDQGHLEQIPVHQQLELTFLQFHQALGDV